MITDENDLRSGLRALSGTLPPPPEARAEASVRRAHAIRRRRAAVTAVAVLVPGVAFGGWALRPEPAPKPDYSSVLSWPDRRDPALRRYERVALADWRDSQLNQLYPGETVRWLYSGRIAEANEIVVAFATCGPDACRQVVLLHDEEATALEDDGDSSMSNWVGETRELVAGAPMAPLSDYLASADRPDTGPRTVLFVLPAPDAARVSYVSPERAGRGGAEGTLERQGAAFVGDVGYLAADATITVRDADGDVRHEGRVGDDDAEGNAELIKEIDLGPGWDANTTAWGQLGRHGDHFENATGSGPNALFVRCVGAAPIKAELNGRKKVVPCDGQPHHVAGPFPRSEGLFTSSSLTSDDPYVVFVAALAERV